MLFNKVIRESLSSDGNEPETTRPMQSTDHIQIEERVGIHLPESYKAIFESDRYLKFWSELDDFMFISNPDRLIKTNLELATGWLRRSSLAIELVLVRRRRW